MNFRTTTDTHVWKIHLRSNFFAASSVFVWTSFHCFWWSVFFVIVPSFASNQLNNLSLRYILTHWGRDKMDAIFQTTFFKCIFLNENVWISLKISLKFVPRVPVNNIPALVLIKAWRRPGNKPLSEPMIVSLPTHICVTRPQWVRVEYPDKSTVKPLI